MQVAGIPRQYDIEVGPWDADGNPTRRVTLTNFQTNSSYVRSRLMPSIPIGLMFSRGGFFTPTLETHEDCKSVWLITLVPIRVMLLHQRNVYPDNVPQLPEDEDHHLNRIGSYFWMRWNRVFVLQNADNEGIMVRVVEHGAGPPEDVPPIHYHHGDHRETPRTGTLPQLSLNDGSDRQLK